MESNSSIVIKKASSNYSAYVPYLPGCVAIGNTIEEVKQEIKEAISFHLEGLQAERLSISLPSSITDYVEAS